MKKQLLVLLCAISYIGTVSGQPKVVNSKFIKENAQWKAEAKTLMEEHRMKKYAAFENVAKNHGYSYKRSLLENDESWGIGFNYSSDFPIGVSGNYAQDWYMLGIDLGFCVNPKEEGTGSSTYSSLKKTVDGVVTENHPVSYFKNTYKPIGYVSFTPSIYARYFAIGCGIGTVYGTKKEFEPYRTSLADGSTSSSSTVSTSDGTSSTTVTHTETTETYELMEESKTSFNFLLRPTIHGFIPLKGDELKLSVNVAYNFVSGNKDLSGISFCIGIQKAL